MTIRPTKMPRHFLFAAAMLCAAPFVTQAQAEPPRVLQVAQADTVKSVAIEISKRKVVGKNVVRVSQGDEVRLDWTTDEPVELHLHGYDIEAKAAPGKPAIMEFTARASGRFPVEAHGFDSGTSEHGRHGESTLLYLEVLPK